MHRQLPVHSLLALSVCPLLSHAGPSRACLFASVDAGSSLLPCAQASNQREIENCGHGHLYSLTYFLRLNIRKRGNRWRQSARCLSGRLLFSSSLALTDEHVGLFELHGPNQRLYLRVFVVCDGDRLERKRTRRESRWASRMCQGPRGGASPSTQGTQRNPTSYVLVMGISLESTETLL